MTATKQHMNATALLRELNDEGFEAKAPIDVDEIARLLKVKVENDPSLEIKDIIGEISIDDCTTTIKVNPIQNSYEPRRRFTIAHEIGHYCLHISENKKSFQDSRKSMSRSETFWDRSESEANNFAAQLLMPKELLLMEGNKIVKKYTEKTGNDAMPADEFIDLISEVFKVSNKAMEYRLKNLSII